MTNKVSINSTQGVYGLFSSFDYTEWQALGEFIDNSLSSWMTDEDSEWDLNIDIEWEPDFGSGPSAGRLTISDNALGISLQDMERAFELGKPPTDKSRLYQFGVGMKVAACWFGSTWKVETSAINDPIKRTINWDTSKIVENQLLELNIEESPATAEEHYTRITITNLYHPPRHPSTIKKIKTYLPKLFRKYLETGRVSIMWNGETLEDNFPPVLVAPAFNDKTEMQEVRWETNFVLDFENGIQLEGYACLFDVFSRPQTGLNYFWRNRLIKGNIEPNHRPQYLFGGTSSFRTGRLYIEIDANDLEVTTDKTAINFGKSGISEEDLHERLKEALKHTDLPISILSQGENYRSQQPPTDLHPGLKRSLDFAKEQAEEHGQEFLEEEIKNTFEEIGQQIFSNQVEEEIEDRIIRHTIDGHDVKFKIACVRSGPGSQWLTIEWAKRATDEHVVFINLAHPFILRYLTADTLPVLVGLGVSLLYGEYKALSLVNKNELVLVRQFTDKFLRYMATHEDNPDNDAED